MEHKIISTGSKGNCVIVNKNIMMDIGVSFAKIKPYIKDVKIVIISHSHSDHINLKTLKKLQYEKPTIRVAVGEFMHPKLEGIKNVDILEAGKTYNYGLFKLVPLKGYHDVPSFGFRIFIEDLKVFFMTDTAHLEGITAKGYDYYFLEHNYDEEKARQAIRIAEEKGEFCHAKGSINSHLSSQQAFNFIEDNRKENSITVKLHQSSQFS